MSPMSVFSMTAINSGVYTFTFADGSSVQARFTYVYKWDGEIGSSPSTILRRCLSNLWATLFWRRRLTLKHQCPSRSHLDYKALAHASFNTFDFKTFCSKIRFI